MGVIEVVAVIAIAGGTVWVLLRRPSRSTGTTPPEATEQVSRPGIIRPQRQPRRPAALPERFIVADIETTGLHPSKHQIIEIGAIAVRNGSDREFFSTLVRKEGSPRLPRKIVEKTGITYEILETHGRPLPEAMNDFLDFIGDDMLVFYNAPFDTAFLTHAARCIGRPMQNRVCCALRLARQTWPRLPRQRLVDGAAAQGLSPKGAHRALVDCEMTLSVYLAAVSQSGRLGEWSWRV